MRLSVACARAGEREALLDARDRPTVRVSRAAVDALTRGTHAPVTIFLGFVTTPNEYYAWTENQCRTENQSRTEITITKQLTTRQTNNMVGPGGAAPGVCAADECIHRSARNSDCGSIARVQ